MFWAVWFIYKSKRINCWNSADNWYIALYTQVLNQQSEAFDEHFLKLKEEQLRVNSKTPLNKWLYNHLIKKLDKSYIVESQEENIIWCATYVKT